MTCGPSLPALRHRSDRIVIAIVAALLAGSCSEVALPAPGPQLQMTIAAGGAAGTLPILTDVAVAPAVLVTDADGVPVANVPILFSPTLGGGFVGQYVVYTGVDGIASSWSWTFGSRAGPQEVVAVLNGITGDASVTFTGSALPGPTSRISFTVPTFNLQVGATAQLSVFPADEYRNATGAALSPSFATSDASIVSVSGTGVVTGHRIGAARVVATSGADADTTFIGVGVRPSGSLVSTFSTPQAPFAVAYGVDGVILAVSGSADRLYAYQPGTGIPSWYVPLEGAANDIALTPDLSRAVVTQPGLGALRVVDLATRAVMRTVSGLGTPIRVALSPDGAHAFVGTTSTTLHRVDVASGAVTSLALDGGTNGLEVDAARGVLYASTLSGTLHGISLASLSVLRSVPLGGMPQGISLSPDGRIFVANEMLGVQVVDIAGFTLTATAAVSAAYDVQVTRDGMEVYVSRPLNASLTAVHAFTLEMLRTTGGAEYRRIAISADGRTIAVARAASGDGSGVTQVR
jgi:WD40 repeat protein